jgi:hypothetical protein
VLPTIGFDSQSGEIGRALCRGLALCSQPVVEVVPVLTGALAVKLERATSNLRNSHRRSFFERHFRSSVARSTSAIVGGGPSFHRLRNTTGGITAATTSAIQLTSDDDPTVTKMSSALDNHSALNDHRIGGYNVEAIMRDTPISMRSAKTYQPVFRALMRADRLGGRAEEPVLRKAVCM